MQVFIDNLKADDALGVNSPRLEHIASFDKSYLRQPSGHKPKYS